MIRITFDTLRLSSPHGATWGPLQPPEACGGCGEVRRNGGDVAPIPLRGQFLLHERSAGCRRSTRLIRPQDIFPRGVDTAEISSTKETGSRPRERHEVQQHHRELCSARLPDAGEDASRRGEQSAVVLTIVRAPQPLPRAATG